MKLYPFEHGIPLSEFGYEPMKRSLGPYGRDLDESQTREILDHFSQFSDITDGCLERTLELEDETDSVGDNRC